MSETAPRRLRDLVEIPVDRLRNIGEKRTAALGSMGINNIFDRDPPLVDANIAGPPFGNGNTYPGTYDSLGRNFFFGATLKF